VSCEHRLEDSIGREDTEKKVPFLIAELERPGIELQPLELEWLRGQLLTYLRRFEDLREHWLDISSLARSVWESAAAADAAT